MASCKSMFVLLSVFVIYFLALLYLFFFSYLSVCNCFKCAITEKPVALFINAVCHPPRGDVAILEMGRFCFNRVLLCLIPVCEPFLCLSHWMHEGSSESC